MFAARVIVIFTMLAAVIWQSALTRFGLPADAQQTSQHTAMHWQEQGHHHHDDGSFHLDDTPESMQHVLTDQPNVVAVLGVAPRHGLPSDSASPDSYISTRLPHPHLDGPLRPPRDFS
jgi:hypothetical protein